MFDMILIMCSVVAIGRLGIKFLIGSILKEGK